MDLYRRALELKEEIVAHRRYFHTHAEVGLDMPMATAYVTEKLTELGLLPQKCGHGVTALLGSGSPVILLRADMDALPMAEESGEPFACPTGQQAHCCGHDMHAAMLLGAACVLNEMKDSFAGSVKLLFQPAEETVGGAVKAIEAGAMDHVDAVFGCHIGNLLGPDLPSGTFSIAPGCVMASVDSFKITVHGKGCHGYSPEKGVDPITIAAHIVINLQEILAREVAAAHATALTVGYIRGGDAANIVPDTAELGGTLRALAPANRAFVLDRIREIAASTAALFRGSCTFETVCGAKTVENDPAMAQLAARAAKRVVGEDFVQTSFPSNMGSEDFSEYLALKPGAFYFLSAAADESTRISHHNPRFNIDERVLWKGSAVFVSIVEEFLNKGE